MPSYYNKIEGTLKAGRTARAEDIHSIQSEIQDAFKNVIMDMFGTGFVIGEAENDLKLYPVEDHTDQKNENFSTDGAHWLPFYETYFRQPIDITKSSIHTITVHMKNESVYDVTVYAEIRDAQFNFVAETNALLRTTPSNQEEKDAYQEVDFVFQKDHLPVGRYFFVIRPVDISATDLTMNGDEIPYNFNKGASMGSQITIPQQEVEPEMFCIKFDKDGFYNQGLEVSYDGKQYLESKNLPDLSIEGFDGTYNFDLYFTHTFSSGRTYFITNGSAMVLGEKVYPLDTHVSIKGPSDEGDRTDLIYLTTDGRLQVLNGPVYESKKIYPTQDTGLAIAYITTYKSTNKNTHIPLIEQHDENNMTRHRDVLERLRRLEKKIDYQIKNNSPSRIKYNCTVDPTFAIDNKDDNIEVRGEGSYNISSSVNSNGENIITDDRAKSYAWSIIDKHYKYSGGVQSTKDCLLTVYDAYMPVTKPANYQGKEMGKDYYAVVIDENDNPIPNLTLTIDIKKQGTLVETAKKTTDNKGVCTFSFYPYNLSQGTYNIFTSYNDAKTATSLNVHSDSNPPKNVTLKSDQTKLTIFTTLSGDITYTLPDNVIPGNDSFYTDNIEVDTEKGEVRVKHINNAEKEYTINNGRKLLKDSETFSADEYHYKIKNDKHALTSEYPLLHFTLERDTYIKSITPYIEGFKNIDSFGILIFENNYVFDMINPVRQVMQKRIGNNNDVIDDAAFPTIFRSGYKSLTDLVKQSGDYKAPKTPIEFNVEAKFTAGTYTLMIFASLENGQNEGEIKIKEYKTLDEASKYGIATKCIGGSQLSIINMDTSNLTDRSWDVAFNQKVYDFYDTGILISKPITTELPIKACNVTKNVIIPDGCSLTLEVSDDNGNSWQKANNGHVTFSGENNTFKWKMTMTATPSATPKLVFNKAKNYAIHFMLATSATYVEYEDFHQCYETPLLNANQITRFYGGNRNNFREWEFARVFMEDSTMNSSIDILLSYNYDDYSTSVESKKDNWHPQTFFKNIFADLKLSDFSRESIDYSNYNSDVEYDEYNYPFGIDTDYLASSAGGVALASPDTYYNGKASYIYGNINRNKANIANNFYDYNFVSEEYVYEDNSSNETQVYTGMHITSGPYYKAKLSSSTPSYTADDSIIGISFPNGLEINANYSSITLGIIAGSDNNSKVFAPNTFKIAISLNQYGETGESTGIEIPIKAELKSNEYTEITLSIYDDLKGIIENSIGSIGIKAVNPNSTTATEKMQQNDWIGLGRIITYSYNIRPYLPYSKTGSDARLKWVKIPNNDKLQAYGLYRLDTAGSYLGYLAYYPIDNTDATSKQRTIDTFSDPLNGDSLAMWLGNGTSRLKNSEVVGKKIVRNDYQIKTRLQNSTSSKVYTSKNDVGNQTMFDLPKNTTGQLFKIDVDIPYTTYNFVQIEYYMFCECFNKASGTTSVINSLSEDIKQDNKTDYLNIQEDDNYIYRTDGSFSKGDIIIEFYDTRNIKNANPVEKFVLPAWGRVATRAKVNDKCTNAIFKKRSNAVSIKTIVLRRENPRKVENVPHIRLCLNNIVLFNAHSQPALGPQMAMRIYPDSKSIGENTKIRKIGGVYRI